MQSFNTLNLWHETKYFFVKVECKKLFSIVSQTWAEFFIEKLNEPFHVIVEVGQHVFIVGGETSL